MSRMNVLLATVFALFLAPLSTSASAATPTYVADMEVTYQESISVAQIWARPGLLRMSASGGRAFTGMITDYRQDKAWALAPAAGKYQQFPVSSLRDHVPHFFDPALQVVSKKEEGREMVEDRPANRYRVVLDQPGRRGYSGLLWEAVDLPGYPLRWEDQGQAVVATWKNAALVDVSDDFFALPTGYSEQKNTLDGDETPVGPAAAGETTGPPI
ncbi:MAG: hypothetical protein IH614_15815 [Desulfuromonadales bacterium]|nr:hypothetical protein [Desulfuromonadales bacterium]